MTTRFLLGGLTAVGAMSAMCHADYLVHGAYSARVLADISLQRSSTDPVETAFDDRSSSTPGLSSYQLLGNTGGRHPYLNSQLYGASTTLSSTLNESHFSRLWTGATGDSSYLSGMNRFESVQSVTVVEGNQAGPIEWHVTYTMMAYPNLINPVTAPVHRRGIEFSIIRNDGLEVAAGSRQNSGFDSAIVYEANTPYSGFLSPGDYTVRSTVWAEWDGYAQNGDGWSTASVQMVLRQTVPGPGAVSMAATMAGLAARRRRR